MDLERSIVEQNETRPCRERGRRAYYRVSARLPIRITPLAPDEVDAAVFDLSMPDPLCQSIAEGEEDTPLMVRLRRIEEKLDRLLGAAAVDVPRPLGGRDQRPLVFSGSGLALDVDFAFAAGDHFQVEILLPPPHGQIVRAVARAVGGSSEDTRDGRGAGSSTLALSLLYMDDEERDALVAYSYDLQRFALRTKGDGVGRAL